MSIDSHHTKVTLESLHPNIHVQRHPDHPMYTEQGSQFFQHLYWAHHDKLVVVDQQVAFIGGLDLCFGRYDDSHHRLVDDSKVSKGDSMNSILNGHSDEYKSELGNDDSIGPPSSNHTPFSANTISSIASAATTLNAVGMDLTWIGQDYSNPRIKDFVKVAENRSLIDRSEIPRMPWHDVQCCIQGNEKNSF